jgi:hypothetical protein
MTAPFSKRSYSAPSASDSQVVVRDTRIDVASTASDMKPARTRSKLPTFIKGRVLARRFLIDHVFEVTSHGTFLRAHDLQFERVVLIRLQPRPESDLPLDLLSGWFRRMDQPLLSSNILGTLGAGVLAGGWPILVCQYWPGRSLEVFLRSGEEPNLLTILRIARQVALTLDEAHRLGQTHGDLRSDDVWLGCQADGSERAMLLGFQPRGGADTVALVARDLDAFGDLLSSMVASLLPRYRLAAQRGISSSQVRESGLFTVIVGPLARVAARCQGVSSEHHYASAAEVASALERVETIAQKFITLE